MGEGGGTCFPCPYARYGPAIAFLNGELEEEVYKKQPQGFVAIGSGALGLQIEKHYGLSNPLAAGIQYCTMMEFVQ